MSINQKIDLVNKFIIDELDEVANGLGTEIINYFSQDMSPQEHYKKMNEFEIKLKEYNLTTDDIYLNKGIVTGKLLSTQFKDARNRLDEYVMIEDRFQN